MLDYAGYGSLNIPYWININSFSEIAIDNFIETLVSDIRQQLGMWNKITMHDGSGLTVNLFEVGIGESVKPDPIDGREVIEIYRCDSFAYAGSFNPNELSIKISCLLMQEVLIQMNCL